MSDDWAMPQQATDWLRDHIPHGSNVIELGSGSGTKRLAEFFNVWTVEHNPAYIGKHYHRRITYVFAPILHGWYDAEMVFPSLPAEYAAIIVDGPPGSIGRNGFVENLPRFKRVPILLDDVHRHVEGKLAMKVAHELATSVSVHILPEVNGQDRRAFAVVGKI